MKPIVPNYTGSTFSGDSSRHDGRLRPVIGVHEVQVARSLPSAPERTDGRAFDFRHHPFLLQWSDRFWVYHLGARGADESSKRGMLQWSGDGLSWNPRDSIVIFDQATHQRAAFYVASNGRALVTTWYGCLEEARGQRGARLVRELLVDANTGAVAPGPVYVLKVNHRGLPPDVNAESFETSPDDAFRTACRELLANKLYVQQWQEEDQDPEFYPINKIGSSLLVRAFAWYSLDDGRIVGMWKGPHLLVASEADWRAGRLSAPVKEATHYNGARLIEFDQFGANGGSKQWGQRTSDGKFAMVFNAPGELHKRWPLVVATSKYGLQYDSSMMVVCGDIPPQRYADAAFDHKDGGAAYVRGIEPNNPQPADSAMWLTYSTNKEDVWLARIPVPIVDSVASDVVDEFTTMKPGPFVPGWNVRSPQLARVMLHRENRGTCLRLADSDASDYAKAVRVFEKSAKVEIELEVTAEQADHGELHMEVLDGAGTRPVRIRLDSRGQVVTQADNNENKVVGRYGRDELLRIRLKIDATASLAVIRINNDAPTSLQFAEPVADLERFELRTGAYRLTDLSRLSAYPDFIKTALQDADVPVREAAYRIYRFAARADKPAQK